MLVVGTVVLGVVFGACDVVLAMCVVVAVVWWCVVFGA